MDFIVPIVILFVGVPMAFVYAWVFPKWADRSWYLKRIAISVSLLLALSVFIEVVASLSFGILGARSILGRGFEWMHVLNFFFSPGAAATLIICSTTNPRNSRRVIGGAVAAAMLIALIGYQLYWGDTMYGIDGQDGPYSSPLTQESA